jgi:DNA-binding Xre family transcriptional regulator
MKSVAELGLSDARHLRGDVYEVRVAHRGQAFRVLFAPEGRRGQIRTMGAIPADDLDRYISERARSNRSLPARVAVRTNRRVLQRLLAERRLSLRLTQTEAAVLMRTSQSAIARLESGEHDVRVSTLERYAEVLGCSITMSLNEAS